MFGQLDAASKLASGLCAVSAALALVSFIAGWSSGAPAIAWMFMILWLTAAGIAIVFLTPRNPVVGFLIGLFCLLVGWRIAGLYLAWGVAVPAFGAFLALVWRFVDLLRASLRGDESTPESLRGLNGADWHLIVLRLLIGLIFVPHFTEKLFAGPGPHLDDVKSFIALGASDPNTLVWIAGLCELASAIGVGLGVLCRLATVGASLYLLIASVMGHHFTNGFIWANPGGGWEYPALWIVIILSFFWRGAGAFSLDSEAARAIDPPVWLRWCMGYPGARSPY